MPVTTFDTKNVRSRATSFAKLKVKPGEPARVVCMEPGPVFNYCHDLRIPRMTVDGKPLMENRERKNRDTGLSEVVQDYAMDYIGSFVCLGDIEVLQQKGVDPDRCPGCVASTSDEHFWAPQRKFAVHVARYETKENSTALVDPFSVKIFVWTMTENRYASVSELLEDGESGDPREVDLLLTNCKSAQFQNYEIHLAKICEWMQTEERRERTLLTYQNNHASDLSAYCGSVTTRSWMQNDVDRILEQWVRVRRAEQGTVAVSVPDMAPTLDASIIDTRASEKPAGFVPPPADAPPGQGSPLNEFLSGGSAQDAPPQPGKQKSFADIIDSLKVNL